MKLKKSFLVGILAVSMACIIVQPNKSNAALQSNGGTAKKGLADDWIMQVRQMQELGGTLGRTDTVDKTNLTSNATDLDIHMEKNTEYGAMVILSASAYGNPNKIDENETTTGNSTGIVINFNGERVAAGLEEMDKYYCVNYNNAKKRYKNIYSNEDIIKIGDAMNETLKWHGSKDNFDISWYDYDYPLILRSYENSIFSFNAANGRSYEHPSAVKKEYTTRACIVVGTGI